MRNIFFTITIALGFALQASFAQSLSTFINEVNYLASNPGERGVEIAGEAGQNLSGWSIVVYALDGTVDFITYLSAGIIPDQQNGYGTIWYDVEQSGNGGGLALVNAGGNVVQFISYGTINYANVIITAVAGPANGLTSEYIGTQLLPENGLQLTGTGLLYDQFIWSLPGLSNPGAINLNQFFSLVPPVFSNKPSQRIPATIQHTGSEEESIELQVFPNPSNEYLFVKNNGSSTTWIQLIQGDGRMVVKTFRLEAGTMTELDISELNSGIHLLVTRNGSVQKTQKIIKQ